MTTITSPLTDEGRKTTGEALQASVVDLIDLALTGKQLHWHTQGPRFRDVHLQLDVVVGSRASTPTPSPSAPSPSAAPSTVDRPPSPAIPACRT